MPVLSLQAFNDKDPIFVRLFPELVSGQLFTDPSPQTEPEEATGATEEDKGSPAVGPPAPPSVSGQMARCAIVAPAPGAPVSPAPGAGLAPVAGARDWLAAAEADGSGGAENETGGPVPGVEESSGKNAARNRKKRDKEREKRRGGGAAVAGVDETGAGETP